MLLCCLKVLAWLRTKPKEAGASVRPWGLLAGVGTVWKGGGGSGGQREWREGVEAIMLRGWRGWGGGAVTGKEDEGAEVSVGGEGVPGINHDTHSEGILCMLFFLYKEEA